MNDRLKLAKLLNKSTLETRFGPFTDANDDYAVLCFFRQTVEAEDMKKFSLYDINGWNYKIGDWARAYLGTLE